MSGTGISRKDVDEILRLIESSEHVAEFSMKYGDTEISVSRSATGAPAVPGPARSGVGAAKLADADRRGAHPVAAGAVAAGAVAVKAPMVGTFYRAAAPGAAPFVEVGSRVQPDTVVGIIEVMKLMNSLAAGAAGTVQRILVSDSQPVGFGDVLIVIDPDA